MKQMKVRSWPLRPSKIARDLAGLTEFLDALILDDPAVSSAAAAASSVAHVYTNELALFFTDQPLAQERALDALEAQWLERRTGGRGKA
ncbi:MAG TPA: hypothetical protein VF275_00360 [Gammaproteobacteria bacterium]